MALQRLSGDRTLTENKVPRTFRFAEEKHRLAHRRWRILDATYTTGCSPQHMAETRPLRTGSLNADPPVGSFGGYRDLALYEDEATAQRAARDVQAADSTCGRWQDLPSTDEGVHLAVQPRKDGQPDAAVARAVAQWGNAVFVATAGALEPISRSDAISHVRAAVAANRPLVCKVARGCA
jgi:hypothetical protein